MTENLDRIQRLEEAVTKLTVKVVILEQTLSDTIATNAGKDPNLTGWCSGCGYSGTGHVVHVGGDLKYCTSCAAKTIRKLKAELVRAIQEEDPNGGYGR